MWGRELPRRRPWDQSELMDPAHPLLWGETLDEHLRLSGNRGLFGFTMMMPRRETPERAALTHKQRERLSGSTEQVSTVDCNCRWLCVGLSDV